MDAFWDSFACFWANRARATGQLFALAHLTKAAKQPHEHEKPRLSIETGVVIVQHFLEVRHTSLSAIWQDIYLTRWRPSVPFGTAPLAASTPNAAALSRGESGNLQSRRE